MKNTYFSPILSRVSSEKGLIFPYVLIVLLVVSSLLLSVLQYQVYEEERFFEINAQDSIQNLIQISLYDFDFELHSLNLNFEKQFRSYEYVNGNVTIEFYLVNEGLLKLELKVETMDEIIYRFSTELIV